MSIEWVEKIFIYCRNENFLKFEKFFVGEDGVDESDDLKGFSQTHAVSENGATARVALLHAFYALHHAVIHELNSLYLMRFQVLADTDGLKMYGCGTFDLRNTLQRAQRDQRI